MKPLTPIHPAIRRLNLLGLLAICNIIFIACVNSNPSSITPGNNLTKTSPNTQGPELFVQVPTRIVGIGEVEIVLMCTDKIPLLQQPAITIRLESSNEATFQLIKTNGESAGAKAKLSEVTKYTPRYQEDMTQPIKIKLDKDNGREEATVTIIIQQGDKILAKKAIDWVKGGINIDLQTNSFRCPDQGNFTLTLNNLGSSPVDLRQVFIDCKCTDPRVKFMLGTVSSDMKNTTVDKVTNVGKLASHLNNQMKIKLYESLKDPRLAVGLKVTLTGREPNKNPQELASISLVCYTTKIDKIRKEIYQWIGEKGEKLDSLQSERKGLTTCLAKLQEGVALYKPFLAALSDIQRTDQNFMPLISNLIHDYNREMGNWESAISKIQQTIQNTVSTEELNQRFITLQQELAAIPNTIEEKLTNASNVQDITDMLISDYNRELPIAKQSISGLLDYAKIIRQELVLINQQQKKTDVDLSSVNNQVKAIKKQVLDSLEQGFEKYKSTLSQQQASPFNESVLKDPVKRNESLNQLNIQAGTLSTWTTYLSNEQGTQKIGSNTLYVVKAYENIAYRVLDLAHAYNKDSKYQGNIHDCADLATRIATEAMSLAEVNNDNTLREAAYNTGKVAIEIVKMVEKLPQAPDLYSNKFEWSKGQFSVVSPALDTLRNKVKHFKPAK